jgi:hypothetical protein
VYMIEHWLKKYWQHYWTTRATHNVKTYSNHYEHHANHVDFSRGEYLEGQFYLHASSKSNSQANQLNRRIKANQLNGRITGDFYHACNQFSLPDLQNTEGLNESVPRIWGWKLAADVRANDNFHSNAEHIWSTFITLSCHRNVDTLESLGNFFRSIH